MSSKLSTLEILTLEEAADYLRLSPAIVHQKASCGIIPGQSIDDHSWRFLKSAIDDWLRRGDSRSVLLSQAGIFAGDDMLMAIQEQIDIDRQQNRFEDEV
jgi:Helix-turn-helix domain